MVHGAGRVHRNMSPESILLMVQSQHWRIASFTASALMGALLRQLVWHRAAHARAVLLKLCHTACLIKDVRDMTQCKPQSSLLTMWPACLVSQANLHMQASARRSRRIVTCTMLHRKSCLLLKMGVRLPRTPALMFGLLVWSRMKLSLAAVFSTTQLRWSRFQSMPMAFIRIHGRQSSVAMLSASVQQGTCWRHAWSGIPCGAPARVSCCTVWTHSSRSISGRGCSEHATGLAMT